VAQAVERSSIVLIGGAVVRLEIVRNEVGVLREIVRNEVGVP
jgi:hypothetical protein